MKAELERHSMECLKAVRDKRDRPPYPEDLRDLLGKDLRKTVLSYIDFRGMDFDHADCSQSSFQEAILEGVSFHKANLHYVNFSYADLRQADLRNSYIKGSEFVGARLEGALLPLGVPTIDDIDKKVLKACIGEHRLNMNDWHTCDGTHCRGGWAIHFAGDQGYRLQERFGPNVAAALIYAASGSHPVPDWYAPKELALEDIRLRARGEQ